jgi:hypothetical protein
MHVTLLPELGNEGILVWNKRPWTNEAHLARNDVEQLRKLVEMSPTQRPPDARQAPRTRELLQRLSHNDGGAGASRHRPELEDPERSAVPSDAALNEQHRAAVVGKYRQGDEDQNRRKQK